MTVYLGKLEGISHFQTFILNIATQPRTYMVLDLDTQNGPQHPQVKREHTTVCERGNMREVRERVLALEEQPAACALQFKVNVAILNQGAAFSIWMGNKVDRKLLASSKFCAHILAGLRACGGF